MIQEDTPSGTKTAANRSKQSEKRVLASWRILSRCNFKCAYCYSRLFPGKDESWDVPRMIETLKATGKKWSIGITGGEPFLYPGFVDVCQQLVDNDIPIGVDTNLSVTARVKEFAQRIPPSMVEFFYASTHIAERRRLKAVDRYIDTIRMLQDAGYTLNVNYVLKPSLIKDFRRDAEYFAARGVALQAKPFKGMYRFRMYPEAYSEEEKKLILESDLQAFEKSPFYSNGLLCNAGRYMVRINRDGSVIRCEADETVLGHIYGGINLLEKATPCTASVCPCFGWHLILDNRKKGRLQKSLTDNAFSPALVKRYAKSIIGSILARVL